MDWKAILGVLAPVVVAVVTVTGTWLVQRWLNDRQTWRGIVSDAELVEKLPEGATRDWLRDYVDLRVRIYGVHETQPRYSAKFRLFAWSTIVVSAGLGALIGSVLIGDIREVGLRRHFTPWWDPAPAWLFMAFFRARGA